VSYALSIHRQRRIYHEALEARACIRGGIVAAEGKGLKKKLKEIQK